MDDNHILVRLRNGNEFSCNIHELNPLSLFRGLRKLGKMNRSRHLAQEYDRVFVPGDGQLLLEEYSVESKT